MVWVARVVCRGAAFVSMRVSSVSLGYVVFFLPHRECLLRPGAAMLRCSRFAGYIEPPLGFPGLPPGRCSGRFLPILVLALEPSLLWHLVMRLV